MALTEWMWALCASCHTIERGFITGQHAYFDIQLFDGFARAWFDICGDADLTVV